ncbi:MAG: hypothetical protein WCP60_07360 [bacterium]
MKMNGQNGSLFVRKVFKAFLPVVLITTLHADPVLVQLGEAAEKPFHGTTQIGLNLEMSLTSDRMWNADNHWMARTLADAGFKTLRWGYSAIWWDAFAEKPLTDNYWSAENTKDAYGSFGFKEFVSYCKETHTVPLIMLPVDAMASGVPLERVLDLSRRMTEYVASQHLETPVYLEAGNEPYTKPKLAKEKYAQALRALYPLVKSIQPSFRLVAQINEDLQPYIIDTCKDSFDAIEWHHYLKCGGKGTDPWQWYCQQDHTDLFRLSQNKVPVIPSGKEYLIGEINVLWPDWFFAMAGDLHSSLVYLNLLLDTINANQAQAILPWPSQWPSLKGVPGYGLFDYDAFTHQNRTRVFPGVMGVHRMIHDYVLTVPITVTSADPKIKVFAYAYPNAKTLSLILINKHPEEVSVRIPLKQPAVQVSAHKLSATNSTDTSAKYSPVTATVNPLNELDIHLAPESAFAVKVSSHP